MDLSPLSVAPLGDLLICMRGLLSEERELHLDVVMNLIIVLKDDVIVEIWVSFVTHNPVFLQSF